MIKKLTKFFLKVTAVLTLVLALLVALLYYRQDAIKALAIESINQNLNSPISVGAIELSLAKFPQAAIKLDNVFSAGAQGFKDTLFSVESLYLQFDLWQILTSSIEIENISLENGRLSLEKYGTKQNWDIFSSSDSSANSPLSLDGIFLKNIAFDYRDRYEAIDLRAYINSAFFKGALGSEQLNLNGKLNAFLNHIEYQKEIYISKPMAIKSAWTWQDFDEKQTLNLQDTYLAEELNLNLVLELAPKSLILSAQADALELSQALKLYQRQGFKIPEEFLVSGPVSLNYQLENFEDKPINQSLTFTGEGLNFSQGQYIFEDFQVKGSYRSIGESDVLEINELKQGDDVIALSGSVKNLIHPEINFHLKADLSAQEWLKLLPLDSLNISSGNAQVDLQIAGKFQEWGKWSKAELNAAKVEGLIQLDDINLSSKNLVRPIEDLAGKLSAKGNEIRIEGLSFKTGASDILLNGNITNLWSYLLLDDAILGLKADLQSEKIALEDFVRQNDEPSANTSNIEFARRLQADLSLKLKAFSYQSFAAKMLKGRLIVSENLIKGEGISLLADEGSYEGAFSLDLSDRVKYQLDAQLQTADLEIESIFKSFANFGQETITAEELSGRLTSISSFSASLSPTLSIDVNSLKLSSSMSIDQGRLKDYEPMLALSRFAEVDELKDVRFNTLTNTISINQGLISFPEMTISSNVLNMELSGSHSFENEIDYLIRLRLSDVLFSKRKAKAKNSEFDAFLKVEERDDDHRVPISILGTVDNPLLKVEAQELGKALQTDLQRQKEELKKILKKEEPKKKGTGLQFEWDEDDDN
tara:strand:+ start:1028 stop:3475 length:2448 start_codon:yes stop_codon:yes gene_type:complete